MAYVFEFYSDIAAIIVFNSSIKMALGFDTAAVLFVICVRAIRFPCQIEPTS
jgi:hypothetical protein